MLKKIHICVQSEGQDLNILLNLVPVVSGGGLQNAVSFISSLSDIKPDNYNFIIACRDNSKLKEISDAYGFDTHVISPGLFGRVKFELFSARHLVNNHKIEVVLTLFGNKPVCLINTFSISGFAYSNIIQNDLDFWNYLPLHKRVIKKIIDILRLRLAKLSDVIVLETEYLKARAEKGVFQNSNLKVIKMSPSKVVLDSLEKISNISRNEYIDILLISGDQPNKRIHLMASILGYLSKFDSRYRVLTTLPDGEYLKKVKFEFDNEGLGDKYKNLGTISPMNIASLLSRSSAVANIARLESFSNNWVEAWAAKLPLISTDSEWARASCMDAAIYINPEDPLRSAEVIHSALSESEKVDELVANGIRILKELPSPEQKTFEYMQIIEKEYSGSYS